MPPKLQQIQNLIAHEGKINTISLCQQTGAGFATGGDDRHLNLWSIGSNSPRESFGPFQSAITACKFNQTEDKILCGNNGGTVMLFDLNETRCTNNWSAHRSAVHSLAFHLQNPQYAASCGYDGRVNLLSTQQRRPVQKYEMHKGPANSVDISPDGKYIASGGDDHSVRIFDVTAQRQLMKFDAHTDIVTCVRFHPNEQILISSSADRTIHFYDLIGQKEIPVNFPLDSSPVEVVKFLPTEKCALTASSDYIKVVGWNPPELFDHFVLGIEQVHDICYADGAITIASSANDHAIIFKVKVGGVKPFNVKQTSAQPYIYTQEKKARPTTPRLLDIQQMKEQQPIKKPSPEPQPTQTSSFSNGEDLFRDFRKNRSPFMNSLNEKFSRLTRISDMIDQIGLAKTIHFIAENGDLGEEMLSLYRKRPEIIKIEHAASLMQIAVQVFGTDYDLALSSVESLLQSFGKLVQATNAMPLHGVGTDPALEDRKKKCDLFVEAFRDIAPQIRTLTAGNSSTSDTAREILEDWKVFLR